MKEENYTQKEIQDRFKFCWKKFITQQTQNVKAASIVNVNKIKDLHHSPLMHIKSDKIYEDYDSLGMGLLSSMMYIVNNNKRNTGQQKNILESIISDYLDNVNIETKIRTKLVKLFVKEFNYTNCFSKDASEFFYTLVNFVSSNLEKNIKISPRLIIDPDDIVLEIFHKTQKQNISDISLYDKQILDAFDSARNMLANFFDLHFDSEIYPDLEKDEPIRKALLEDFILYGYYGYKQHKIHDCNRLINISPSRFMYLKDDNHNISFLIDSHFQYDTIFKDKDDRIAHFDTYVYNEESNDYDFYKCKIECKKVNLQQFLNFDPVHVKFVFERKVKELPISVVTNDMTHLYGSTKTVNYFNIAVELKLAEFNQKYNITTNLHPPMNVDAVTTDDAKQMNAGSSEMANNSAENIVVPGAINKTQLEQGMSAHNMAAPIQISLPQTGQLLEARIQYLSRQMMSIFHNTDLMQYKSLAQANQLNGQKMVNNIITNMASEYSAYKKLIDASVNISLHKNILQEIKKIQYILNGRKKYTDLQANIFLRFLSQKLNNQENGEYDLIAMWCFYFILNSDAGYITDYLTHDIDAGSADSANNLYKAFVELETLENHRVHISLTSNTEYTFDAVKDLMSDLGAAGQLIAQFGQSPVPVFNTKKILDLLRKTEYLEYINSDAEIKRVTEEMQKAQQQEQDNFNKTLEAQKSKN